MSPAGGRVDDRRFATHDQARDAGEQFVRSDDCQHEIAEDCLICMHCGRCSESLDDQDVCAACRG